MRVDLQPASAQRHSEEQSEGVRDRCGAEADRELPQPAPQPVPQYDGLEALLQQILQGQQTNAQAMQTMTQTLQANALGLGIQQQPAADAATVTARIIDPTYGKEVK